MPRLPTFFVSHGAPTMSLELDETTKFWKDLGKKIKSMNPRAVLMVSAHWETPSTALKVTASASPSLIYDFYGFPRKFYDVKYPAKSSPEVAQEVADVLNSASIPCELDHQRGLDHGAWVPAIHMIPNADIPVLQLSLSSKLDPQFHVRVGEALSPLRDRDIVIMGSGGATHNLGAIGIDAPWAKQFEDTIDVVVNHASPAARSMKLAQLTRDELFSSAHPRSEHYVPMVVAAGAAHSEQPLDSTTKLHSRFVLGSLSLAAYQFGVG